MKSVRTFTTALAICMLLALFGGDHSALAELRDPFVANPIGPFSSLNNPASVMQVTDLTWRVGLGQGGIGDDSSQLVAYMEPDMGTGAGALYWHGGNLWSGGRKREIGYTVARKVNDVVTYGVTVKHVREDAIGTWAADIGVMTTDLSRLRAGVVVHNLAGQTVINPTHVTGSLAYDLTPDVSLAASLSSPVMGDTSQMESGVAVDVMALPGIKVRLGRITNVSTLAGYWLGSVQVDVNRITFDANVYHAGEDTRVAIGAVYRF